MLTLDRNAVNVDFSRLTTTPDSTTYVDLAAHTPQLPSTLDLRRKLPDVNGIVERTFINRRRKMKVNVGTELERIAQSGVKVEIIHPVDGDIADTVELLYDVIGMIKHATFATTVETGILPAA